MNQSPSEDLVAFNFDDATLAMLTRICAKENKSPSMVIHEMIQEEARRHGLLKDMAKSA